MGFDYWVAYWDADLDLNSEILRIKRYEISYICTQADFQSIGVNMLLWAAAYGKLRMVELVLRAGVNVECRNVLRETSLHVAARNDHCTVVKALLRANASVLSEDCFGETPLTIAVEYGRGARLVAILLAAKADVNHSNKCGDTALHLAAVNNDAAIVQLLLAGGAILTSNVMGETPLHFASTNSLAAVKLLLSASADPNVKNENGNTPLHLAARWDRAPIVRELASNGADILVKNESGLTPVDDAFWTRSEESARILFDYWLLFHKYEGWHDFEEYSFDRLYDSYNISSQLFSQKIQ